MGGGGGGKQTGQSPPPFSFCVQCGNPQNIFPFKSNLLFRGLRGVPFHVIRLLLLRRLLLLLLLQLQLQLLHLNL